ncbi:MAG: hypothetical protein R3320_04795 [Nitriliruptorales bacterium]|nr:hypothetical protein [Nitriliruptorales bacterium]
MTDSSDTRTAVNLPWPDRWLAGMGSQRDDSVSERLARGRYYASRGGGSDLTVERGRLSGRVPEGRLRPRLATIDVPELDDQSRAVLIDVLASEVRFLAAALEGELPPELADALTDRGVRLVPTRDEVEENCTCGEVRMPCRHVATLHHAFSDRLEEDPLPLLRLRGQDPTSLLAALRERRRGGAPPAGTIPIEDLGDVDLDAGRGDLEAVALHPRPIEDPGWLLEHLGNPPGVDDLELLEARIAEAADFAWKIAAGEGSDAADEELLLAELRAQRVSSAAEVADGLGWDAEQTRDLLDELFHEGRVLRMGSGEDARYRAAG